MTAQSLAISNSGHNSAVRSGNGTGHRRLARHVVALPVLAAALLSAGTAAEARAGAHAIKPAVAAPAATTPPGEGDKVAQALARGDIAGAQVLAEAAVAANPHAAGVRVVLGRVYLRAGRFESAAGMLADARTLGDTSGRTALGLALAQIACGHEADALALLDAAHDTIPVGDYGLALAMAGDAPRGITILGDALRGGDQSPKLRQNLAYAFALGGRWGEARMMAAFDTPADKLDGRLSQWAETAQPDAARLRVANLISVPMRSDAGAPPALALASVTAASGALAGQTAAASPATLPGSALLAAGVAPDAAASNTAAKELAGKDAGGKLAAGSAAKPVLADASVRAVPPVVQVAVAEPAPAVIPAAASPHVAPVDAVVAKPVAAKAVAENDVPVRDGAEKDIFGPAALATKTDANGELPAVDHARPSPALAAALAPALAAAVASAPAQPVAAPAPNAAFAAFAANSATTEVILHRADTTKLVGVALARADVVAAHKARHHGGQKAGSDQPTSVQPVSEHLASTTPAESRPAPATPLAVHVAVAAPANSQTASSQTASSHIGSLAAVHPRKIHGHKDTAVAEAAAIPAPANAGAASATHLVQLGSFSSQQNAEHARQTFIARDPALGHRQFVITQALVNGRNFWRVAVMGFDANSAGQTCGAIRHHGGACFAYAAGHLPGGQALALVAPARQDHLARR